MWQRLQTLYLALGFGFIFSLFFCTFISYEDVTMAGEAITETLKYRTMRLPLYVIMLVLLALIQFFSIMLFKSRMVQMWLVIFNALVALGFQALLVVDLVLFTKAAADLSYSISYVSAIFPLVVAILNFLAAKNIMLDEAMVQSASRLRRSRRK